MNEKTVADLNALAESVANKLGVHAGVQLEETERSDISPGGPRLILSVFRNASTPPRRMEFRPDAPDLEARIEKEISALAQLL
jgi:molybdopterin-biosynthesis enzyme MoeA-like protein